MIELRRSALAAACAIATIAGLRGARATTLDVAEVMQLLAQTRRGSARFTERRWLAVLKQPIEASGELSFEAPSRFVKRTLLPRPETLRVDGAAVQVERGGRSFAVDLDAMPDVAAIVEAVRGTLTGDRRALERVFAVSATGTLDAWTLALLPSDPRVAQSISHIRIAGARHLVRTIEIVQADGDRSLMTIEAARAQ